MRVAHSAGFGRSRSRCQGPATNSCSRQQFALRAANQRHGGLAMAGRYQLDRHTAHIAWMSVCAASSRRISAAAATFSATWCQWSIVAIVSVRKTTEVTAAHDQAWMTDSRMRPWPATNTAPINARVSESSSPNVGRSVTTDDTRPLSARLESRLGSDDLASGVHAASLLRHVAISSGRVPRQVPSRRP
jgi:hypothetical protein